MVQMTTRASNLRVVSTILAELGRELHLVPFYCSCSAAALLECLLPDLSAQEVYYCTQEITGVNPGAFVNKCNALEVYR